MWVVISSSNGPGALQTNDETEVHQIDSVSGTSITLKTNLAYKHYGDLDQYTYSGDGTVYEVRFAAEVGLLTRNVVF